MLNEVATQIQALRKFIRIYACTRCAERASEFVDDPSEHLHQKVPESHFRSEHHATNFYCGTFVLLCYYERRYEPTFNLKEETMRHMQGACPACGQAINLDQRPAKVVGTEFACPFCLARVKLVNFHPITLVLSNAPLEETPIGDSVVGAAVAGSLLEEVEKGNVAIDQQSDDQSDKPPDAFPGFGGGTSGGAGAGGSWDKPDDKPDNANAVAGSAAPDEDAAQPDDSSPAGVAAADLPDNSNSDDSSSNNSNNDNSSTETTDSPADNTTEVDSPTTDSPGTDA